MRKLFMIAGAVLLAAAMSLVPKPADVPAMDHASPVAASEAATMVYLVPLVAKWEGKRNAAYFDAVNVPTICYGHTRTVSAADVRAGTSKSDLECEQLLRAELREYRNGVRGFYEIKALRFYLPPKRDAAFASLAYNIGISGAGGSTAVRRLNAGDLPGACEAITWWNRAGQRILRGLVNRRAEEFAFCMDGI